MASVGPTAQDYAAKALECELWARRTKAGPEVARAWRQLAESYETVQKLGGVTLLCETDDGPIAPR